MTYNTGNPVPSIDPRDLDDNSRAFDRFMHSPNTQEPDRLGVPRLTWSYVEAAATALVNPNVIGLASLTSGQYKVPMFNNSSGAMVTFTTGALGRTLAALENTAAGQAAGLTALGAAPVSASLTALGAVTPAANSIPYYTSTTAASKFTCTVWGRGFLGSADSATGRTAISSAPIAKTAAFTVAATDIWLVCSGTASITVTLPDPATFPGRELMFKTTTAFTVISATANVAPLTSTTAGTAILAATAGKWATLVSNGTAWVIMQGN